MTTLTTGRNLQDCFAVRRRSERCQDEESRHTQIREPKARQLAEQIIDVSQFQVGKADANALQGLGYCRKRRRNTAKNELRGWFPMLLFGPFRSIIKYPLLNDGCNDGSFIAVK